MDESDKVSLKSDLKVTKTNVVGEEKDIPVCMAPEDKGYLTVKLNGVEWHFVVSFETDKCQGWTRWNLPDNEDILININRNCIDRRGLWKVTLFHEIIHCAVLIRNLGQGNNEQKFNFDNEEGWVTVTTATLFPLLEVYDYFVKWISKNFKYDIQRLM